MRPNNKRSICIRLETRGEVLSICYGTLHGRSLQHEARRHPHLVGLLPIRLDGLDSRVVVDSRPASNRLSRPPLTLWKSLLNIRHPNKQSIEKMSKYLYTSPASAYSYNRKNSVRGCGRSAPHAAEFPDRESVHWGDALHRDVLRNACAFRHMRPIRRACRFYCVEYQEKAYLWNHLENFT